MKKQLVAFFTLVLIAALILLMAIPNRDIDMSCQKVGLDDVEVLSAKNQISLFGQTFSTIHLKNIVYIFNSGNTTERLHLDLFHESGEITTCNFSLNPHTQKKVGLHEKSDFLAPDHKTINVLRLRTESAQVGGYVFHHEASARLKDKRELDGDFSSASFITPFEGTSSRQMAITVSDLSQNAKRDNESFLVVTNYSLSQETYRIEARDVAGNLLNNNSSPLEIVIPSFGMQIIQPQDFLEDVGALASIVVLPKGEVLNDVQGGFGAKYLYLRKTSAEAKGMHKWSYALALQGQRSLESDALYIPIRRVLQNTNNDIELRNKVSFFNSSNTPTQIDILSLSAGGNPLSVKLKKFCTSPVIYGEEYLSIEIPAKSVVRCKASELLSSVGSEGGGLYVVSGNLGDVSAQSVYYAKKTDKKRKDAFITYAFPVAKQKDYSILVWNRQGNRTNTLYLYNTTLNKITDKFSVISAEGNIEEYAVELDPNSSKAIPLEEGFLEGASVSDHGMLQVPASLKAEIVQMRVLPGGEHTDYIHAIEAQGFSFPNGDSSSLEDTELGEELEVDPVPTAPPMSSASPAPIPEVGATPKGSASPSPSGCTPRLEGKTSDFNRDGKVDKQDLDILMHNYGNATRSLCEGDANGDGQVDGNDILILQQEWNASTNEDSDGDGVIDSQDCAYADEDLWRNKAYSDSDGDNVRDSLQIEIIDCFGNTVPSGYTISENGPDNCVEAQNSDQSDVDGDGIGDVCDDIDNSGSDGGEPPTNTNSSFMNPQIHQPLKSNPNGLLGETEEE